MHRPSMNPKNIPYIKNPYFSSFSRQIHTLSIFPNSHLSEQAPGRRKTEKVTVQSAMATTSGSAFKTISSASMELLKSRSVCLSSSSPIKSSSLMPVNLRTPSLSQNLSLRSAAFRNHAVSAPKRSFSCKSQANLADDSRPSQYFRTFLFIFRIFLYFIQFFALSPSL